MRSDKIVADRFPSLDHLSLEMSIKWCEMVKFFKGRQANCGSKKNFTASTSIKEIKK